MLENEEFDDSEWESTEFEIIEEVKKFARRANEHDKEFYDRLRVERAFASGDQWNEDDKTNRGDNRAQMTINLCPIFLNAVVNPFSAKPFKFKAVPRDSFYTEEVVKLNTRLVNIQNDFATNESNSLGLYDSSSVGIGFTYATIEDDDGEKKIKYLHIEDQTMVIVDPDAKGVALEQSERIAVVDFMPYSTAKRKFGEDIVTGGNPEKAMLTDFGSCWEVPKEHVAIVTYFRKDGHNVEYFRLCADHIVDYGVFEGLEYLPVFAFTGDRIWLNKKRTFAGMVRKLKSEQRTINYAQSQLIERLAKSPKGFFRGYTESFNGYEDDYQNAEYGNSYILRGNLHPDESPNEVLPLPEFIVPHVMTEDLQSIITQSINQMSVATGVSPNGITEQNLTDQKTATEVLLRTKTSQSNISNYINHAKETIRISGNVIAHLAVVLYGLELPKGSYDIIVEEGCVSLTKMEEDREKLLALAQIVPENFKPLITQHLVKTLDIEGGQELSQQLYNMLPAELRGGLPSMQEFQAMQIQMQEKDTQLQQLNDQIKQLNDQLTQAQLRTQSDLILADKRFEHDVAMKQLDFAHNQQQTAEKMLFDAKREQAQDRKELEKQAQDARERLAEKVVDNMIGQ